VGATRGQRVGHVGRDIRPTTTEEHLKAHFTTTGRQRTRKPTLDAANRRKKAT
jgi:hypothetical protein